MWRLVHQVAGKLFCFMQPFPFIKFTIFSRNFKVCKHKNKQVSISIYMVDLCCLGTFPVSMVQQQHRVSWVGGAVGQFDTLCRHFHLSVRLSWPCQLVNMVKNNVVLNIFSMASLNIIVCACINRILLLQEYENNQTIIFTNLHLNR